MGVRTGNPRGRPAGAKNKHTVEREERMEEAAKAVLSVLPEGFGGDAHTLLMAIYKDTTLGIDVRLDAAKAAIRYEKPALSSIQAKLDVTERNVIRVPERAATVADWKSSVERRN